MVFQPHPPGSCVARRPRAHLGRVCRTQGRRESASTSTRSGVTGASTALSTTSGTPPSSGLSRPPSQGPDRRAAAGRGRGGAEAHGQARLRVREPVVRRVVERHPRQDARRLERLRHVRRLARAERPRRLPVLDQALVHVALHDAPFPRQSGGVAGAARGLQVKPGLGGRRGAGRGVEASPQRRGRGSRLGEQATRGGRRTGEGRLDPPERPPDAVDDPLEPLLGQAVPPRPVQPQMLLVAVLPSSWSSGRVSVSACAAPAATRCTD